MYKGGHVLKLVTKTSRVVSLLLVLSAFNLPKASALVNSQDVKTGKKTVEERIANIKAILQEADNQETARSAPREPDVKRLAQDVDDFDDFDDVDDFDDFDDFDDV